MLHEAYAERLWRGVARLLGPHSAEIADVVQETMMAAAKSARGFDDSRGSLWGWLWGIARIQVALHFRRQERRDRLTERHGQAARPVDGTDAAPPVLLEAAERAGLVRAALGELSDDYELILTAVYLDGETVARIAERERSTETAVRSRLARARDAFRQAFGRRHGNAEACQ